MPEEPMPLARKLLASLVLPSQRAPASPPAPLPEPRRKSAVAGAKYVGCFRLDVNGDWKHLDGTDADLEAPEDHHFGGYEIEPGVYDLYLEPTTTFAPFFRPPST